MDRRANRLARITFLSCTLRGQNIIGARVRKLRGERGWTQDQLAAACQRLGWDMSRVTLAKIETGVRAVNDGEVVVFASALGAGPEDLHGDFICEH